ncbi:holo-ACP synthase CitX [Desulfosporosinus orientis DSM 765]|uniref:citrate lyase holo-[acyl-carrier protein] synthase n=1 Tax=Desulfosporosinus orientis (strain ATCC 19365 / DSM 765 / NCIMB 8382 / VKM B-1628 / Singapore I) TaxID=768706 RepID=G7W711_DESOD|nr:citrate lyase holo-[acyl-carrier protein] synthase [Desulfosporosinus orientis]AET69868.1 holo-ACP synthase CitX [Desulfosporosinus orientis DSM 765]
MTETREITLEQLLKAREQRVARQKKLLEEFRLPLVSYTVNIPGACKKTPISSRIFHEGCNALKKKLRETGCSLEYFEAKDPDTGYEAYLVVKTEERILKEQMLQIENEHPLGRLFDLDVIGATGIPISREKLGYAKRKCLLCDQDAHSCGRSRKHTTEALLQKIKSMVDSYFDNSFLVHLD